MKFQLRIIAVILAGVAIFGISSSARAAMLSLSPVSSETGIGEKMTIEVRVDSEGASFNAAQAVIRFPKDTLEVVSLDKTGSAFSFWLEEPHFSNTDGIVSFTGGTPYGVSGGAVEILKIEFRAKGIGNGTLSLTEAAITAADGSGANVLSKTNDAVIAVVSQRVIPKIPEPQQKIPEPEHIVRKPVSSGNLPSKPVLKIPLYPEESRWYNLVSQFTASWSLPPDISGISTALDKNPGFTPVGRSEGLFDNKTFVSLSDGVWYLHVRFQNNVGWGPAAHYRLAIDTNPPLGFEANILEGEKTDNPALTLQFQTSDALSGIKEYQIRVGNSDVISIPVANFIGTFKLPLQPPGEKRIFIKAVDLAGNGVEDSVDAEILPIASPTITFVPKELFSEDEQGLVVKGTALPDTNILVKIQNVSSGEKGEIVAEGTANADDKGNWEFAFGNQPLRNGQNYIILAQVQDTRGALSLVVESQEIRVKPKPIIQIGAFQLGMGGAALLLLLLLVGGFGSGIWFYKTRQGKLAFRIEFAESEITKIFKLISEDVDSISAAFKSPTTGDDEYAVKRLRENIKKMETYVKKGVEKINR